MIQFAILAFFPALTLAQPGGGNISDTNNTSLSRAEDHLFNTIDINSDGRILEVELEAYFLSFDKNTDGDLSEGEFGQSLDYQGLGWQGQEAEIYKLFDRDHNDEVTKSDIDAVFKRADVDNNDVVTKEEFKAVLDRIPTLIG